MANLATELAQLPADRLRAAEELIALSERAARLAERLGLDRGDVFHGLLQLQRSPAERLAIGLRHGQLRSAHRR